MGVAILVLGAVVVAIVLRGPAVAPVAAVPPLVQTTPPPAAPAAAPTPPPVPEPVAQPEAPKVDPQPTVAAVRPTRPAPQPATAAPAEPAPKPEKPDPMDDLFEPARKTQLTRDDIMEGVRSNTSKVDHCIDRATRGNELAAGSYKITLDWRILPNGSVTEAKVTGPLGVLDTSLPACFALAMRQWTFKQSDLGAPVRNFPFGPIQVR